MRRQVKLTESELYNVIKEAVKSLVMEYGEKNPKVRSAMAKAAKRAINNGDDSIYHNSVNSIIKGGGSKKELNDFNKKFEMEDSKQLEEYTELDKAKIYGVSNDYDEDFDDSLNSQPANNLTGEGKEPIKVTESQLKDIIKESVLAVLKEGQGWNLFKNTYNDIKNGEYDDWLSKGGFTDYEEAEYEKDKDDYINHSGYSKDEPFYDEEGKYSYNNSLGTNKKVNDSLFGKFGRRAGTIGSDALLKLRKMKLGIK